MVVVEKHEVGSAAGEKKFVVDRNAIQIAIFWYFIILPLYPLKKHMTSGSIMRGKAGLIWVIKIFNCLHSL
jgi:hypothetical protein